MKPYIVGHRGASGYAPENTLAAFNRARELGADGVEFDVHLTRDGVPVVIHDERVDRTTNGQGLVKELSLKEIKELDAGSQLGAQFAGEKILTLAETLEAVRDFKIINIELKSGPVIYPGLEEKVLEAVDHFGLREKVIISSFNHYSLYDVRKLDSEIKIGVLYMSGLFEPWDYAKKLGADVLHPYFAAVTEELVKESQKRGFKVNTFGANDEVFIKRLIQAGVDMIITDFPDRAISLREKFWEGEDK